MIHIITIVFEGVEFLVAQLAAYNQLTIPWHWHIVPGCNGRHLPIPARSQDGTDSLVFDLGRHCNVTAWPPGTYSRKCEQDAKALADVPDNAILLYADADELWTPQALMRCVDAFASCDADIGVVGFRHFVRPDIYLTGDFMQQHRFFRRRNAELFKPTETDDPPSFFTNYGEGSTVRLFDTPQYDHYGFMRPAQVYFKERRSQLAHHHVINWKALDQVQAFPADVSAIFPCWRGGGLTAHKAATNV